MDHPRQLAPRPSLNDVGRPVSQQHSIDQASVHNGSECSSIRAPIKSKEEWESQKENFRQIYVDERRPLRQAMAMMRERHGFFATEKQYKTKVRQWNMQKYTKRSEVLNLVRQVRQELESNPKKQSAVRVRRQIVNLLSGISNSNHSESTSRDLSTSSIPNKHGSSHDVAKASTEQNVIKENLNRQRAGPSSQHRGVHTPNLSPSSQAKQSTSSSAEDGSPLQNTLSIDYNPVSRHLPNIGHNKPLPQVPRQYTDVDLTSMLPRTGPQDSARNQTQLSALTPPSSQRELDYTSEIEPSDLRNLGMTSDTAGKRRHQYPSGFSDFVDWSPVVLPEIPDIEIPWDQPGWDIPWPDLDMALPTNHLDDSAWPSDMLHPLDSYAPSHLSALEAACDQKPPGLYELDNQEASTRSTIRHKNYEPSIDSTFWQDLDHANITSPSLLTTNWNQPSASTAANSTFKAAQSTLDDLEHYDSPPRKRGRFSLRSAYKASVSPMPPSPPMLASAFMSAPSTSIGAGSNRSAYIQRCRPLKKLGFGSQRSPKDSSEKTRIRMAGSMDIPNRPELGSSPNDASSFERRSPWYQSRLATDVDYFAMPVEERRHNSGSTSSTELCPQEPPQRPYTITEIATDRRSNHNVLDSHPRRFNGSLPRTRPLERRDHTYAGYSYGRYGEVIPDLGEKTAIGANVPSVASSVDSADIDSLTSEFGHLAQHIRTGS